MLSRRRRRRVSLDCRVARILDSGDAGTRKPLGILLRHAMHFVCVVATTEEPAKSLERRCQNLDDFISTFFPGLIAAACVGTRILEYDRVRITFTFDGGRAPHRRRGDGQYKSD